MDTLELNPETVSWIADKAREFQGKESVELPETPVSWDDDAAIEMLATYTDDLSFQEVKSAIEDLEPDQQASLVALMWLGRGDYGIEDWDALISDAEEAWNPRTSDYLLATPLLADYLEEGLSLHGYARDEG